MEAELLNVAWATIRKDSYPDWLRGLISTAGQYGGAAKGR